MLKVNSDLKRKQDHVEINLAKDVDSSVGGGFDAIRFTHNALPELHYDDIDISVNFMGKKLDAPIMISSMTGGTEQAKFINSNLALAAQEHNIPMALGSMRVLLKSPETLNSFHVRAIAPDILLLANIGAVQLNYGVTPQDCQKLVDLVQADGLILHLNLLQELTQPEGDKDWSGLLKKIENVIKYLRVPVIIKEVGYGISYELAARLIDIGARYIDVAGAGGTSWTQVEAYRAHTSLQERIAHSFQGWGIPTTESVRMVKNAIDKSSLGATDMVNIISSGGVRSGIDGAKSIALGADIFALAKPFLLPATIGAEEVSTEIMLIKTQLKIAMHALGTKNINALKGNLDLIL
jgi:isopentenyl-diphosphate delta-isomerase